MNNSEQIRWQIVGAHRMGINFISISRTLHVPETTVRRVVNNFLRRGTVSRKKGSGRPRKTTPRSDRMLVRLVKSHRFAPSPVLLWRWGEQVSRSTVFRRLKEAKFQLHKPPLAPFLSPANIESRLNWTMTRVLWRLPMFRRIVWTDESRFRLFKNDGRVKVWRVRGERFRNDLMLHTSQGMGGSIHIWGAFWYGGRSDLQVLQRNVNGIRYAEVIQMFLMADSQHTQNFFSNIIPQHTLHEFL